MKKVLYLSYDGLTDPLGQSQILPYLIGLTKAGYQFTIISFEKPERFGSGAATIERLCKEHQIEWRPLPYTKFPPVLSTVKDIRKLRKEAKRVLQQGGYQIVHCRSYITALAGLWLKRTMGVKMVFDMRGFWADERVDGGLWNLKNPLYRTIYRYFKKKELQFFKEADYTISLTHQAKAEILSWKALQHHSIPVQVIPCCVDLDLFSRKNVSEKQIATIKETLQIPAGSFVISYVGSIGTWYMLDEMLLFFKEVVQEYPNAILLFVTKENKDDIWSAAVRAGIAQHNIRITESARNDMPAYIASSHCSLFFIKPAFSKKASSPTKQGEIMAMGIPVICNDNVGDTSYVVEHYHSGVVFKEFKPEAFRKALAAIRNTSFSPEEIRKGAMDFYALEKGVESYKQVYEKIVA